MPQQKQTSNLGSSLRTKTAWQAFSHAGSLEVLEKNLSRREHDLQELTGREAFVVAGLQRAWAVDSNNFSAYS